MTDHGCNLDVVLTSLKCYPPQNIHVGVVHSGTGVQDLAKCLSESRIVENDIAQSSSRMGECSEGEVDLD